jgi:hypothetical protein
MNSNNGTKKSNWLKKMPNGSMMPNEKSSVVASFCDEELQDLPPFNLIPVGLVLIAIVDNGSFEAALIVDNEHDYERVRLSWTGENKDPRPVRLFLLKREWVNQMAERPLEGGA